MKRFAIAYTVIGVLAVAALVFFSWPRVLPRMATTQSDLKAIGALGLYTQDYDEQAAMAGGGAPGMQAMRGGAAGSGLGGSAARQPPASMGAPEATYNPNMYVSSTYIGGAGARDRLEKLVNEGVLVDGQRIKLAAFSRNYAQAFPIPTKTALGLIADTERTKILEQGGRTFLQVGIQARKGERPRRPALNVTLVMDRSGSMADADKLDYAKSAALDLVDRLHAGDIFSLVIFDDKADVLISAKKARDKAAIKQKINGIRDGGGTNIFDGLKAGYAENQKNAGRDGVNLVILLSDGEVTSGVSDQHAFELLANKQVDSDIQTTSVGVGLDYNEELMLAIAREGKGNYHFIKDGPETQQVFATELDELTHVVARAVKVRIKLAKGVGLVRVLGSQELDAAETARVRTEEKKIDQKVYEELGITPDRKQDDPGIKTFIPNFHRGDSHVIMLELHVPKGKGRTKLADVFLKFKDLEGRKNEELKTAVYIDRTRSRQQMTASINRNVKKNLLGFQTGEALMKAATLMAQGRISEAVLAIDNRMTVLGLAAKEWKDADLDRDGALLARYHTVLKSYHENPMVASNSGYGDYLQKSLTYSGYRLTR